ncbi:MULTISPECIES: hypothetical protein [Francisella]|uniref:Prepilin-type N-terminal cleavage/methylation domain-containing protein n=1 Tax=Francisella marina TaxID=2249302 RepID=A0ABX5ZF08_9GAMM|nr:MULTISPECIES: hypothetical protein [Francisella]QEO56594.1 hypothetical protein F0R74_01575 [Francisella marina]QEO59287.1 hypothetical protein F0R75_05650 [Francisella marina]
MLNNSLRHKDIKGLSFVELIVAMTIICSSILAFEFALYKTFNTVNSINKNKNLTNLINNRFNEFIITGSLDTTPTNNIDIQISGSTWIFQSKNDPNLKMSLNI